MREVQSSGIAQSRPPGGGHDGRRAAGGRVIAAFGIGIGIGIVVTHRASRLVHFAHAATGTFIALAYAELRATGHVVLAVLGLLERVHVIDRPTTATALVVIVVYAAGRRRSAGSG